MIYTVTAFLDWNTQIHNARPPRDATEFAIANATMDYVGRVVGSALFLTDPIAKFDVTLRAYHGWHKGFQPMPRRKAMIQSVAAVDFSSLSRRANVSIRPNIEYGDLLISALPTRGHHKLGCHLPNTCRRDPSGGDGTVEKMIDTAMASDVVDTAHREKDRWILVVADDDDAVPALFVAESARRKDQGRVLLVRKRASTQYLKLDGIWVVL